MARAGTDSFFAGSGFVGFCAFAQKHLDRVAPVRYGAVMIPCIFSLGVMDAFHFVAQSAAYRGNDADLAVRARGREGCGRKNKKWKTNKRFIMRRDSLTVCLLCLNLIKDFQAFQRMMNLVC